MRIYIRLKNGRNLKLPAPIGLVKAVIGLGGFGVSISRRFIPLEQRQYIDCINFKELRKGMDVLRDYKGLKILEVKAGDGPDVTVII